MATLSGPAPLASLAMLPQPVRLIDADTLDKAPSGKGAYLLLLHFAQPADFTHKGKPRRLEAGWYAYAGSAYGPGGIRARLGRHLRRDKKLHWHVDHLTAIAGQLCAVALEGDSECRIADALLVSGAFRIVLEGFGSSDCAHCRSHLLQWDGEPADASG